MSITKTLGGERLNSGKRMQVSMHGYERSTHNLSNIVRTTMSAGTVVPFIKKIALPGDTHDIEIDSVILTQPTVGPLFGSFIANYNVFAVPIRLYQRRLHNNELGIGMKMQNVLLPTIELEVDISDVESVTGNIDNTQINPSCILAYLGVRGIGWNNGTNDLKRSFHMTAGLAYWDIIKNYYINKQEDYAAVIHTAAQTIKQNVVEIKVDGTTLDQSPTDTNIAITQPGVTIAMEYSAAQPLNQVILQTQFGKISLLEAGEIVNDTGTIITILYNFQKYGARNIQNWYYADARTLPAGPIGIQKFTIEQLDQMREAILAQPVNAPFKINNSGGAPGVALDPWSFLLEGTDTTFRSRMFSQEGLALKTYQSDLLNNWLNTEWIEGPGGINEISRIDVSSGYLEIDALRLGNKVNKMMNRIMVSGGSYNDWQEVTYDHRARFAPESPMFMGGLIKELVFQEVVSNSESTPGTAGTQPLGTLAGRGRFNSKHKGGKITVKVDEPCYIIGLVSLTPRIDYSQGNDWDMYLETFNDFHKPEMDGIGFQDLLTRQMAWWSSYYNNGTSEWVEPSAGKQPAWINYMTEINKIYGNFAIQDNEGFMVLNRNYEWAAAGDHMEIDDLTTYIDPEKYNHIFAQTSLDSQNFWVQISVDWTARRKMSAKQMPNL